MCYFCACFSSIIDLIQRTLTFCLACILSGAVCFGIIIAVVAGIAYGYNYSMAEFITFTRSDVTVFMRRGQFYDKPDIPNFRRSGSGGNMEDDFPVMENRTTDYEEPALSGPGKPLADSWLKTQDTRKYAEKLTKYSPPKLVESPVRRTQVIDPIIEQSNQEETSVPNAIIPTMSWLDGTPDIVMRNFKPLEDMGASGRREPASQAPVKSIGFILGKSTPKELEDIKVIDEKSRERFLPMRPWLTTIPDYVTEELDEDNIVYKPV